MDDWTEVSDATKGIAQAAGRHQLTPIEYLASHMAREDAQKVVDLAGIETLDDLALLADKNTFADIAKGAGLKIIPARKLTKAIHALVKSRNNDTNPGGDAKAPPVTDFTKQEAMPDSQTPSTNGPKFDECIVVAIDRSGSMGSGLDEAKAFGLNAEKTLVQRSRMDAVKQCFYAFRDRTESLGSDTHHKLGLLQFDGQIDELLPLTNNLDQFEALVDDMKQRGSTAIYSAISHACRMLKPYHDFDPKTDLRVLVLTDGQNNSGLAPRQALREALEIGVVVDAIIVGDQPDANLRKIVTVSGGTCFQIRSLSDGFELMEAEAVVSLQSRRGDAAKPPKPDLMAALASFDEVQVQRLTQASQAVKVSTAPANAKTNNLPIKLVPCCNVTGNPGDPGYRGAMGRIVKELKDYSSNPLEGIHIYANENDLFQWTVFLEGPQNTPFEGGVFILDVSLPSNYPFKPPRITFRTPIFHCNISGNGVICLDILMGNWSPALTVAKCLALIVSLLEEPNSDDAMRPAIAELYFAHVQSKGTDTRYMDQAKGATLKEASQSLEEAKSLCGIGEKKQRTKLWWKREN